MKIIPTKKVRRMVRGLKQENKRKIKKAEREHLERALENQIKWAEIPPAEREVRFHPVRRWRFDFAWPAKKLAVEVEGGIFVNGAHTRGRHFMSDCDKYNEATRMGWRVLRFTPDHVTGGSAISFLKKWFYEF